MQEKGQEIPGPQEFWQELGALPLHYVDHHYKDDDQEEWDANYRKDYVIQGNSHDEPGKEEEHDNEVHYGEPPVIGGGVAKDFAEGQWDPHKGNWVINEDAKHIDEEVHK